MSGHVGVIDLDGTRVSDALSVPITLTPTRERRPVPSLRSADELTPPLECRPTPDRRCRFLLSPSFPLSDTHTHSLCLVHTLPLSLTHTHSLSHTHTHTLSLSPCACPLLSPPLEKAGLFLPCKGRTSSHYRGTSLLRNAHLSRTPIGLWTWSHCRVLGSGGLGPP